MNIQKGSYIGYEYRRTIKDVDVSAEDSGSDWDGQWLKDRDFSFAMSQLWSNF